MARIPESDVKRMYAAVRRRKAEAMARVRARSSSNQGWAVRSINKKIFLLDSEEEGARAPSNQGWGWGWVLEVRRVK